MDEQNEKRVNDKTERRKRQKGAPERMVLLLDYCFVRAKKRGGGEAEKENNMTGKMERSRRQGLGCQPSLL